MTISKPEWYGDDNFANVENLFIDLFTKVFPNYESGCWTPDDWYDKPVKEPALHFYRVPGGTVDWQRGTDEAQIQASIVSESRDDSWGLMNIVRGVLLPMSGFKVKMADGFTAVIHTASEVAGGPYLITPGQQADTRVVNAMFRVKVGMKSRRNYLHEVAALF